MSHSKEQLEQILKDLVEEAGKVDLEPKTSESVVDKHIRFRKDILIFKSKDVDSTTCAMKGLLCNCVETPM